MLSVGNSLISDDLAMVKFCCDLHRCKGICCVLGDLGAPIEWEEISIMQEELPKIMGLLSEEGRKVVERDGVAVKDFTDDFSTPLIDGHECAFTVFDSEQVAWCAWELAWRKGMTGFRKPISCHLYPIRITHYGEFDAVNYHAWDVCEDALRCGSQNDTPLYQMLREPLIRKYGEDWYNELCEQIENNAHLK